MKTFRQQFAPMIARILYMHRMESKRVKRRLLRHQAKEIGLRQRTHAYNVWLSEIRYQTSRRHRKKRKCDVLKFLPNQTAFEFVGAK